MKTKHTPGPWDVCADYEGDIFLQYPEVKATDSDITLMNAAPELLEASKAFVYLLERGSADGLVYYSYDLLRKLRLAVSKAEGEKPHNSTTKA
jgi:hypothetical protein